MNTMCSGWVLVSLGLTCVSALLVGYSKARALGDGGWGAGDGYLIIRHRRNDSTCPAHFEVDDNFWLRRSRYNSEVIRRTYSASHCGYGQTGGVLPCYKCIYKCQRSTLTLFLGEGVIKVGANPSLSARGRVAGDRNLNETIPTSDWSSSGEDRRFGGVKGRRPILPGLRRRTTMNGKKFVKSRPINRFVTHTCRLKEHPSEAFDGDAT